jgi:hypothetical protein
MNAAQIFGAEVRKFTQAILSPALVDVDSMQINVKENHKYCKKKKSIASVRSSIHIMCEKHAFQIQTSEYSSEIENLHIHVSTPVAARNHSHMITM